MTAVGVFVIIAIWVACGATIAFVYLYEDREQVRERIAREQGFYPPVRTLKPRTQPSVSVPADGDTPGGDDAPGRG